MTAKSKLNLVLQPPRRAHIKLTLRLDPAVWVKWLSFAAHVEVGAGRRRVDRRALVSAALVDYMRRHRSWEGPDATA